MALIVHSITARERNRQIGNHVSGRPGATDVIRALLSSRLECRRKSEESNSTVDDGAAKGTEFWGQENGRAECTRRVSEEFATKVEKSSHVLRSLESERNVPISVAISPEGLDREYTGKDLAGVDFFVRATSSGGPDDDAPTAFAPSGEVMIQSAA